MLEDVTAIRLRLALIVAQAETDEEFRTRLAEDPSTVLADNGIPSGAVDEYSQALDEGRKRTSETLDDEEPVVCIHTAGCNDFTCITTNCGPTCHITIKIDAPDS
jgi:hypothetical protein